MSLDPDITNNIITINTIPFDKQKLFQHCILFKNIYDLDHSPSITLENRLVSPLNLEILNIWLNNSSYELDTSILNNLTTFLDYIQCEKFLDQCCSYLADIYPQTIKIDNPNIIDKIARKLVKPKYFLQDWIDTQHINPNKLHWDDLSTPYRIHLLKQLKNQINWEELGQNEKALCILKHIPPEYDTFIYKNSAAFEILENLVDVQEIYLGMSDFLSNKHPRAIEIIEKNIHKLAGVDWYFFSANEGAVHVLEKHLDKVDWEAFSGNPKAIHILEKYPEKIDWDYFCQMKEAIPILEKHTDKIEWFWTSMFPEAIHIIEKNLDKVHWGQLSKNEAAIHILEKNLDKVHWSFLSSNKNAIHILEQNTDKINWEWLCKNENAIHILEQNIDKINHFGWIFLSNNKNATPILSKHTDKLNPHSLSENPAIYKLDQEKFDKDLENIKKHLCSL